MSSQQPPKKPRLDSQDNSSTVSDEHTSSVKTLQVKRNSRDRYRKPYPRRLSQKCNLELTGPSTSTFTKASELVKPSSETNGNSCVKSESQNSDSNVKQMITRGMKKSCEHTKMKSSCSISSFPNSPLAEIHSSKHHKCNVTKLHESNGNTSETFAKTSDQSESSCNHSEAPPLVSNLEYFDSGEDRSKETSVKSSSETDCSQLNKRETDVSMREERPLHFLKKNNINFFLVSPKQVILNSSEAKAEPLLNLKKIIINTPDLQAMERKNEEFFENHNKSYLFLSEICSNENVPNYFAILPNHVMENIFCQLPIFDLLRCRLVCKLWNFVISDNKFMDWKMLYYRVKKQDGEALNKLKNITTELGLESVEDTFKVLIRFMAKNYVRKPSSDMYKVLITNELAVTAERVLNERFPGICTNDSKPWTIFAMAIIISKSIFDIQDLYKTLLIGKSNSSIHDVTNAMYCVATFLLYFRNKYSLNYGLGYRVYYVLHLIEHEMPVKRIINSVSVVLPKILPGEKPLHCRCNIRNATLTFEQIRALNHRFQPKQRIKIVALAGSGKTSTLIHLAVLHPQAKILNIVYNKTLCDHAKNVFPENVTCSTLYALAYPYSGRSLRHKLVRKLRPFDLVKTLVNKEDSSLHTYLYARFVMDTINSFTSSTAPELSLAHVPHQNFLAREPLQESDRERIFKDAVRIWTKMIDHTENELKISHDVYLKLFQLSRPVLANFQIIMVDEAQDFNPAMLDIILRQSLPIVFVGDPNQQVYGFRGANRALESIEATHTYRLNTSLRFGPEIAYFASCCLESLKEIKTQPLVGTNRPSFINGRAHGQYAIISRTNTMVFHEAVRLICSQNRREYEPAVITCNIIGGIDSLGLQQILDVCKLAGCHPESKYVIKDKFIAQFKDYEDFKAYATNTDDAELMGKIELVKKYSSKLPDYVKIISEKGTFPMELANIILCTALRSKGLEFDTVCLTDDYPLTKYANIRHRISSMHPSHEEFNIFYMAATRARTCLLMPEKMYSILITVTNEKFEYPLLSESIAGVGVELTCVSCKDTFKPYTVLTSVRREIILSSGRRIPGGILCMKCRTNPKVRMRVELEPVIMYSDPIDDNAHLSMSSLVGLLPNDPPLVYGPHAAFQEMDVVYIINVRL